MHQRTLLLDRDEPGEPGLMRRLHARVLVCWDAGLGGWSWTLLNASGQPCRPLTGPFEAADAAMDAAQEVMGGRWEGDHMETA